ncbi:MAG: hypothetical protein KJ587_12450 [Alphaproteobacteria bacterium]|nr:hypothetical protein [Alphaproteobacteria bacterium]
MQSRIRTFLLTMLMLLIPVACGANSSPIDLARVDDQNLMGMSSAVFLRSIGNDLQISAIETAVETFRSKNARTRDGLSKLEIFYDGITADPKDPRLLPHLARWKELFPQSPTPYVLEAHIKLSAVINAFRLEGLSEQDFQALRRDKGRIEELHALFAENQLKPVADPHWHMLRLRLSLLQGRRGSDNSMMASKALRRFPEYKPLYSAAADLYLPRWGGTAEALEFWAREVEQSQGRAGAPGAYALTYLHAFEHEYGNDLLARSNIGWERFKKSWRSLELNGIGKHFQAIAAMTACVAGDHALAKRLFQQAGSALNGTLSGSRPGRKVCVTWAAKSEWQLFYEEILADVQPYLAYILSIVDLILLRGR